MRRRGPSIRSVPAFHRLAAVAIAGTLLTTSACGTTARPQQVAGPNGIVEVTIGLIPIIDVAPIYLGRSKGYFRERGIDLKIKTAPGGAAIIPGVVSGQFDFGFSNVTSLMIAQTKKLPLQIVASGVASTGETGLDFGAVVVEGDSDIKKPADLAGKKIAVNTLRNIGDITVRQSVRKAGADPGDITFVEMPFPQMPAALQQGRVDAAWVVEPFLATVKGGGGRPVAWNFVDTAKDLTVATYFTTRQVKQRDPDLVRRFTDAVNQSMRFANAHPDQVRERLTEYLRLEQVLLAGMTLPNWPQEINRESLETLAELAKDEGIFGDRRPDLDALLSSS